MPSSFVIRILGMETSLWNKGNKGTATRGSVSAEERWSGRLDLNQRPHAPQACALPGCATSRPSWPGKGPVNKMAPVRAACKHDPVRVASTTFSVSLAFEKRQESAQRVAQIQQHFATQKFRGIFRRRACGSRLHSAPSIFPQM